MESWACLRIVEGQDSVIRGVRMVVHNKIWERPIQLICPLEIKSKMTMEELNKRIRLANKEDLPADTEQRNERPNRKALETAKQKIMQIAEDNDYYS